MANLSRTKKKAVETELLRAPTVAIIDDDVELERAIARILRANYKCVVNGYRSVEDFLQAVDKKTSTGEIEQEVDLILLDFHLPGQDGPKLIEELKRRDSPILTKSHIMGITADSEPMVYAGFRDAGIEEIFLKPLSTIDFRHIADRAYRVCQGSIPPAPASRIKTTM